VKRTLVIVILGLAALMTTVRTSAQLERHPQGTTQGEVEHRANATRRGQAVGPTYQRRSTWYELLLKQINPTNFNYGAWMEERRQVFLSECVHNPYFKYSAGVTLGLLLMMIVYTKLWIDQRRAMWITAEMMADLYNHDLYSRDVAEKAIRKYNAHIERCNRAIEAGQHGNGVCETDSEQNVWRVKLEQASEERDRYLRERDAALKELDTKGRTLAELSLRLDNISVKSGTNGNTALPIELSSADPTLVKHINNLQQQIYRERETNKRLKGA